MLSKTATKNFTDRIRDSLRIMNDLGFGDVSYPAPEIDFFEDDKQYYDPSRNLIHIGIYGILDLFHPNTEEDYFSALNYVRGHEEQHVRSTVSQIYRIAIEKGCEKVLEYIQEKEDGFKRRFRPGEYEYFANQELPNRGIYISWNLLLQIMSGLANSLEDGRIERIRANRFPGFANMRKVHRGLFWDRESVFPSWEEIREDSSEKLRILANQILSLATCQLYEKGFISAYAGTPFMQEAYPLHEPIAKAVMSGRTRGLIQPMEEIAAYLAPYIYDTCKMAKTDVDMQKAIEAWIRGLIQSILGNELTMDTGRTEATEDTDTGSAASTFPKSDLVITLDDETFDKLVENMPESDGGDGIMIRREHPKEEVEEESETGSGASKKNETGETAGNSTESESSNAPGMPEKDQGEFERTDPASDPVKLPGEKPEDEGTAPEQNDAFDAAENGEESQSDATDPGERMQNQRAATKNRSVEDRKDQANEDTIKQIKDAMKEAAAASRTEAAASIRSINAINAHAKSCAPKTHPDTEKVIAAAKMKEICSFKEMKREYALKDNLPSHLLLRGRTLQQKNRQYFKSLSTPNRNYLDAGEVDSGRLFGLAIGDTQVFKKRGVDKKFDGCAYILIDNSGSMAGDKRKEACKAAAVIEEGFKGIMPFKIVAFDEWGEVIHEVVKGWDEVGAKNCCWNFYLHGREGGGNEDGYDIQIATRELLARPEKHKLLVVLSDGTPGDPGYAKKAIANARRCGILVNGVYFEEGECANPQFADMYERDYICCPMTEIDKHLTKIMKKFSRM